MELSMERLKQLVAENAPVLHLHPRDSFMPCSVEFFMTHSELWLNDSEDKVNVSLSTALQPFVCTTVSPVHHWTAVAKIV
jgi:hypothetical protein